MLPLYIDEDSVDRRFISALERLRVEFVSARALGRDGVNDEDQPYVCRVRGPDAAHGELS